MNRKEFAKYIDHTLLRSDATKEDIERLVSECKEYGFYACCVNPYWVKLVKELLKDTDIKICSVAGFPFGATSTLAKVAEAVQARADGADEIDMVINIGALKAREYKFLFDEINAICRAVEPAIVKVIIETGALTDDEIRNICRIILDTPAEFVKTCTGYGPRGVIPDDIKKIKEHVGNKKKIKASGGIRTYEQAVELIKLGATRLGTSRGVEIVK